MVRLTLTSIRLVLKQKPDGRYFFRGTEDGLQGNDAELKPRLVPVIFDPAFTGIIESGMDGLLSVIAFERFRLATRTDGWTTKLVSCQGVSADSARLLDAT